MAAETNVKSEQRIVLFISCSWTSSTVCSSTASSDQQFAFSLNHYIIIIISSVVTVTVKKYLELD